MPKLWSATIDAHRNDVRDAILATTAALVAKRGAHAVTMSQIAEETGIGRATLYKYFSDIEAILIAWHDRHVTDHLRLLAEAGSRANGPEDRLRRVLEAYAVIVHERAHQHHGTEIAALVHRGEHVARAERKLHDSIEAVLHECGQAGVIRNDVAPRELAKYCIHALMAAGGLPNKSAVRRLVGVVLAGLRPPS